ncbi:Uncharacterised protein [Bordetella pertussis]|nr:Uncharacterised protein [Bordetella pertussis]CFP65688.1 Uncharacterised protein [Bordetella pertussis]
MASSYPRPSRSMTPARLFSTRMSLRAIRSRRICLPSSVFRLTAMLRLLRLTLMKYRLSPP